MEMLWNANVSVHKLHLPGHNHVHLFTWCLWLLSSYRGTGSEYL